MASFASSATTGGARKHAWTNNFPFFMLGNPNDDDPDPHY